MLSIFPLTICKRQFETHEKWNKYAASRFLVPTIKHLTWVHIFVYAKLKINYTSWYVAWYVGIHNWITGIHDKLVKKDSEKDFKK